MALSESQARVLWALTTGGALTARELAERTGLSTDCAREAARSMTRRGLAASIDRMPTYWSVTDSGRVVISRPVYREHRMLPGTRRETEEIHRARESHMEHYIPGPDHSASDNYNEDPRLDAPRRRRGESAQIVKALD